MRYTCRVTLSEYIKREGRGSLTRLHRDTGIAYSTLHAIARQRRGKRGAPPAVQAETARKIERATGGAVKAAELLGVAKRAAA